MYTSNLYKTKTPLRTLLLSGMCLMLGACSIAPSKPSVDEYSAFKQQWLRKQTQLKTIKKWQASGKASIKSDQGSGTVSLFWKHAPNNNALKIVAPFGRGTLNIKADATQAYLIDAQGRRHSAANMKGLVWLKTGFEIPFDELQQWILGIAPDANAPSLLLTPEAQTMGFIHQGWEVRYIEFTKQTVKGQTLSLPRKIYITNEQMGDSFSLKLAIRSWTLG